MGLRGCPGLCVWGLDNSVFATAAGFVPLILGVIFFRIWTLGTLMGLWVLLPFTFSLKPSSPHVLSSPPIGRLSVSLACHLAPQACMIFDTLSHILLFPCSSQATAAQSRGSAFSGSGIFSVLRLTGWRFKV